MTDTKMMGAPILRDTGCRVGGHTWLTTSSGERHALPEPHHRCQCGLYAWEEWKTANAVEEG